MALAPELVEIIDYDPAWQDLYAQEEAGLIQAFSGIDAVIEHVGSTAVEGLGAKPIVDIMVGVERLSQVTDRMSQLDALGYAYCPQYEHDIPDRRFFRKPKDGPHSYHLHCVRLNSEFWKDHIVFRDYLDANPGVAADYLRLKRSLAERFRNNRRAYQKEKALFIDQVMEKAAAGA